MAYAKAPIGLMFHHFHGDGHKPDQAGSLSAETFEALILFIGLENILEPNEWISRLENGELAPNHYCLTFDDALKSQFDIAFPVLKRYNLKAFWFIYSQPFEENFSKLDLFRRFRYQYFDCVDDYYKEFFERSKESALFTSSTNFNKWRDQMASKFSFYSINDLKYRYLRDFILGSKKYEIIVETMIRNHGLRFEDLAANLWLTDLDLAMLHRNEQMIGLHSYDHPTNFSSLTEIQQKLQYKKNWGHISRICQEPHSVSHPCNSYNEITLKILTDLGIKVGFRSNSAHSDKTISGFDCLQQPREDAVNILKKMSIAS